MNEKLVAVLKKIFNLEKNKAFNELTQLPEVKAIGGLTNLVESLDEAGTNPKVIAQDLEDVIVCISLKNTPNELEKDLLAILQDVQSEHLDSSTNFTF